MRKKLYIILFAPVLLSLSCDLQMPGAVQIKSSPEFRIAAKFDIGGFLTEFHNGFKKDDDERIKLLDCVNTEIVTYLVYMKLYNQQIPLNSIIGGDGDFTAPSDIELVKSELEVSALDFNDFLKDFSFDQNSVKSKLYISGSPIVNGLSVKLTIDNGAPVTNKGNNTARGLIDKNTYNGTALPQGGVDNITLPFKGESVKIDYGIYVKQGDKIERVWMTNPSVLVELAVWLPFNFTAKKAGAKVELPDDLFPQGDLFSRKNPDSDNTITEMLESVSFAIKMNKNPFAGAKLCVDSAGINIENPIVGTSLEFSVDEQNMKAINTPANFPFVPKLKFVFANGGRLSFPRNFVITEISFKAKLNHTVDLSKGIN